MDAKRPDRVALVVGVSQYTTCTRLPCCTTDAAVMRTNLQCCGWHTLEPADDLDVVSFADLVERFRELCRGARASFFYFSGHGLQHKEHVYLLPTDYSLAGKALTGGLLAKAAFKVEDIQEALEGSQCPLNIMVLDCCRSEGVPLKGTEEGGPGLRVDQAFLMFYAVKPGEVAEGAFDQQLSPFTHHVTQALFPATPGKRQSIMAAFLDAQERVFKANKKKQPEVVLHWGKVFQEFCIDGQPLCIANPSQPQPQAVLPLWQRFVPPEHAVQLHERVQEVTQQLQAARQQPPGSAGSPPTVGLCISGMGGIGKTTLAGALFNSLMDSAPTWGIGAGALVELSENPSDPELRRHQSSIVQQLSGQANHLAGSGYKEGNRGVLWEAVQGLGRPVLLVLDNVFRAGDVPYLLPGTMPAGSVVVVTARNPEVLPREDGQHGVQCWVRHSLGLLSSAAAKGLLDSIARPTSIPHSLVASVAEACGRLPLALTVSANHLRGRDQQAWQDARDSLARSQALDASEHNSWHARLKWSFDQLTARHQQAFLDAATFFRGMRWEVAALVQPARVLHGLLCAGLIEQRVVRDWCGDSCRYLEVHNLLVAMGRRIGEERGSHIWEPPDDDACPEWLMEPATVVSLYAKDTQLPRVHRKLGAVCCMAKLRLLAVEHTNLASWTGLADLSRLRFLAHLDLSYCRLKGRLPVQWTELDGLRFLRLESNLLIGTLPPEWSTLTDLRRLALGSNVLSGHLPAAWSTLISLDTLELQNNQLTGPLPQQWSALKGLTGLWLHSNQQLEGPLPVEWSELAGLAILHLWNSKVSGALPPEWSALTALADLHLGGNQLTGQLPVGWSALKAMAALQLHGNQLNGPLPSEWSKLSKLQMLDVGMNQLTGQLPGGWSSLCSLQAISVDSNQLTGPLPAEWSKLTRLKLLGVQGNKLQGELPVQWSALTGLALLGLADNVLQGPLPLQWSSLTSLTELVLSSNMLVDVLPPDWSALTSLSSLGLSQNQLTGPLPPEWSALTGLSDLWLHSNQLTGPLPAEWRALKGLSALGLHSNQLSGPLPPEWRALKGLSSLGLHNNQLSGPLPPDWSVLTCLSLLRLSDNQLTGPLPPKWSALTGLSYLRLCDNQLTGPLPPEWSALTGLSDLGLNSNQLTGPLPPEWRALKGLSDLWLYSNQLTGPLPSEWRALKGLLALGLRSNQLSGPLLPDWSLLTRLSLLRLSDYQLTGPLPPEWSALTGLSVLGLHGNQLTGRLPAE